MNPGNRLVARELERRWEAALAEAEKVEQEYGRLRLTELRPLDAIEVEDVRRLASDLPSLWQADTTTPVDRKRLLRLVVASATVTVREGRTGADVTVLWSGGARTAHRVDSPEFNAHLRTKAGTLDAIRDLAGRMPDHRVAAMLAQRGLLSRHGKPWTPGRVASMRRQHHIPTGCPAQTRGTSMRADGFVPARVAARQLGITLGALRVWAHRGVLACNQSRDAAKLWIRLEDGDADQLEGCADAAGLERVRDVASRNGSSSAAAWERVRKGEFVACRIQRGRKQWDWRLAPAHLCDATPPFSSHLPSTQKGAAQ